MWISKTKGVGVTLVSVYAVTETCQYVNQQTFESTYLFTLETLEHQSPPAPSHPFFQRGSFFVCLFVFSSCDPLPKHRAQSPYLPEPCPTLLGPSSRWEPVPLAGLSPHSGNHGCFLPALQRKHQSSALVPRGSILALKLWGTESAQLWNNSPGSVI